MAIQKVFVLVLFMITSIISQETIEINGDKVFLSPQFIQNTKLPTLTTQWPRQRWFEKSDSALDSQWCHFYNDFDIKYDFKDIVNLYQLKKLEKIWLDPNKKQNFCNEPLKNHLPNLLLLAIFIAHDEDNDKKRLVEVAKKYNLYLSKK